MVIDIIPTEREPTQFERVVMEIKGYDRLYYFVQDNKQYSVFWTDETIKSFLPNWSVSEYMENHLQNYSSIFCRCMRFWEKGYHPYWTEPQVDARGYKTGKEMPMVLEQKHVVNSAKYWLTNAYKQFTKPFDFVVVKLQK